MALQQLHTLVSHAAFHVWRTELVYLLRLFICFLEHAIPAAKPAILGQLLERFLIYTEVVRIQEGLGARLLLNAEKLPKHYDEHNLGGQRPYQQVIVVLDVQEILEKIIALKLLVSIHQENDHWLYLSNQHIDELQHADHCQEDLTSRACNEPIPPE